MLKSTIRKSKSGFESESESESGRENWERDVGVKLVLPFANLVKKRLQLHQHKLLLTWRLESPRFHREIRTRFGNAPDVLSESED